MRKRFPRFSFVLCLTLVFVFLSATITFAENITITTYYPAPFGIYKELRTESLSIGSSYWKNVIPNNGLIVQGNVGIGTPTPKTKIGQSGFLDAKDVWVRDANEGVGAWVSQMGGFGPPVWNSGWVNYATGTTTHHFPVIAGATADDLFVDIQVKTNGAWVVPAGISNMYTSTDDKGLGLAYTGLTTSSIQVYKSGMTPSITHYRVRIWTTF